MNEGYFYIQRRLMSSDLWMSEPFTRGQAWVDMIYIANYQDGEIRVRGVSVPVKRGQIGYSEVKLAERWKWSRGKVRRFLGELKTKQQIEQQNNNVTTLITITNYEQYQSRDTAERTANGTTDEQQTVQQTNSKRYPIEERIRKDKEGNKRKDNPLPLQKGDEVVSFPKPRSRRITVAQKKRIKHDTITEGMKRIGALFGRRADTKWSVYEYEVYAQINPSEDEVIQIEKFYGLRSKQTYGPDLWKHDLQTLLNQWTEQLDRANNMKTATPQPQPVFRGF